MLIPSCSEQHVSPLKVHCCQAWFHTITAVADRRKGVFCFLHKTSVAQQSVLWLRKKRLLLWKLCSLLWLCCRIALKSQDLRAGWLALLQCYTLSSPEFLWKVCSIQPSSHSFSHAHRSSRGKLDPWDPGSVTDEPLGCTGR